MTIGQLMDEYAGLPVVDVVPGEALPAEEAHAFRVRAVRRGPSFAASLAALLDGADTARVTALVLGYWENGDWDGEDPADLLIAVADRFPNLTSLFLNDVVFEEQEISWIKLGDVTPLISAFPGLERFDVRGSDGLRVTPFTSDRLRTLRFESGGLPRRVVADVLACELPALEHLDLWLGVDEYGGDVTPPDLAPLLNGERFPALRHLGLEDSEIADELAAALTGAPVVARLESLSLALGALTDDGAEALLAGQLLTHLRELDLHHHFLTDAMMDRVRAALPGVAVDLDDQQEPDDDGEETYYFVAAAE
ncbi:STM4015 family protein [Actinomadura atramentaria]|uniref:STM4015 family protein n=1 Tax=Actinomadura atramentaria TaxID=1990 RepID=UPI000476FB15|nr:STM4015 family protein [Actinomadura atramentaria]